MKQNNKLLRARSQKFDEWYTRYIDIERELLNYENQLKDKIIFCNCDDVEHSNFIEFLCRQGPYMGIKKIYGSKYTKDATESYYVTFEPPENIEEYNADNWKDYLIKTRMDGDGDFRSEQSVKLLKESDIIITNPPFSLAIEFLDLLFKYEKKFLFVSNINSIIYKNYFEKIKNNKMWFGVIDSVRWFYVPEDFNRTFKIDEDGRKIAEGARSIWITNLDNNKRHEEMILVKEYYGHEEEYPFYYNYSNAIEVSKGVNIPKDYSGIMGVPITWLPTKYCANQFEIIGADYELVTPIQQILTEEDEYTKGGPACYIKIADHKYNRLYNRIFIRRRQQGE